MSDKTRAEELTEILEPGAASPAQDMGQDAMVSIAISLKRIADKLDGLDEINFLSIDNALWQFGQTFGRGLEIGSRK